MTVRLHQALALLVGCASESRALDPACRCEDGALGVYRCEEIESLRRCGCLTGESSCPVYALEDCDGIDNDDNGEIDDGEVCPDPTVANTTPLTGGVYLLGTTRESQCGYDALQRFWPTQASTYYDGFDCYADWFRFRRSDGALFYEATFSGLRRDTAGIDPLVATPPCGDRVERDFDFDGDGTLYYRCGGTLYRGSGELVIESVAALAGVLDDGRSIVTRYGAGSGAYVVVDRLGTELSRLAPFDDFAGALAPATAATTVVGNRAYVAFMRFAPINQLELVVYRLDEASSWVRVRRAPVTGFGTPLVLSDGTVLVREQDPLAMPGLGDRIVGYLPDGTSQVVWSEAAQQVVRAHGHAQLLIGPP